MKILFFKFHIITSKTLEKVKEKVRHDTNEMNTKLINRCYSDNARLILWVQELRRKLRRN